MTEPRHSCLEYVTTQRVVHKYASCKQLPKNEFDAHYNNKFFADGPFRESFGDGYGEPYNPKRQAFGRLKDDTVVWCELS